MSCDETIVVNCTESEHLGIHLDDQLNVRYVHPYCSEKNVKVGDRLVMIDSKKVTDRASLPESISCRAHIKPAKFGYSRTVSRDSSTGTTNERTSGSKEKDNSYLVKTTSIATVPPKATVVVDVHPKMGKLGLVLREAKDGSVYVYRILNCTIGNDHFYVGDRILEVNDEVIEKKEQVKKIILKCGHEMKTARFRLERPENMDNILAAADLCDINF